MGDVEAMRKRVLIYRATPPQPKEVTEPTPHVVIFGKLVRIKESEIDHYEGFEIKYI
jgi:hypothetical protein